MNILGHLTVLPQLPAELKRLEELAGNLYWTWRPDARALFRHLDRDLWEAVRHNPVALLRDVDQAKLDRAAADPDYLANYESVLARFDEYMQSSSWFEQHVGEEHLYAYLCAEY